MMENLEIFEHYNWSITSLKELRPSNQININ